jgi:hypothetical protein
MPEEKMQDKLLVSIEEFHKEIDLIQACVSRMAQNSFMIKGWAFMLATAFFALTAESLDLYVICSVGIFIFCVFWYLDAFFLKTEKLYRFKYDWVIAERPKGNREFLYDLNPYQKGTWKDGKSEPHIICVMFSKPCTLLMFYGSPVLIGVAVIILKAINLLC